MTIINVVPPFSREMVATAIMIIAYYLGLKSWVDPRVNQSLLKHAFLTTPFHIAGLIGGIMYATSLLFFPWIVLTYVYPAPLGYFAAFTNEAGNLLTLCGLIIAGSAAFLGLVVTAASVLTSRPNVMRSTLSQFFYFTKCMTRLSLASIIV